MALSKSRVEPPRPAPPKPSPPAPAPRREPRPSAAHAPAARLEALRPADAVGRARMMAGLQKTLGNHHANGMTGAAPASAHLNADAIARSLLTSPHGPAPVSSPPTPTQTPTPAPAPSPAAAPKPVAVPKVEAAPAAPKVEATTNAKAPAPEPKKPGAEAKADHPADAAKDHPSPGTKGAEHAAAPNAKGANHAPEKGHVGGAKGDEHGHHEGGDKGHDKGKSAPSKGGKASAHADPAFAAVVGKVRHAAAGQKAHAPAHAKAAQAQGAAVSPPGELKGRASAAQAASIDAEKPKAFDRAAFTKALLDKIASIAPTTLAEADDFKKSGKVAGVKGDLSAQVEGGKAGAAGGIPAKVAQEPDPAGIAPKPVTPLAPETAGPPPADVGASAAVPKPRPDSEVSLAKGSASIDQEMASAKVTESQLKTSNEPTFHAAADAKTAAQADAAKAPKALRQQEKADLAQGHAAAQAAAHGHLDSMHGGRAEAVAKVGGQQTGAKGKDEQARAEVAQQIQTRYEAAKTKVEERLKKLDDDVNAAFEKGANEAQSAFDAEVNGKMSAYKDERYDGLTGAALWAKDKLFGMPDVVNTFYTQARDHYIAQMTALLNSIAGIVETGLNEAKAAVADGRKSIDDYLKGLPAALKTVGEDAAKDIQGKFDQLEQTIDDKQNDLVDSLANKYAEKLKQVDDKIAEMKTANGGLVDAAVGAVKGVIDTIIGLKNMLLNVLAKAGEAIDLIIADPIGFLGNLVAAVKQGFMGFVGKIGVYLEKGLMDWLFGALGGAGIEMPKSFDFRGILQLVLQVLGLTYANIRARAVNILGEKTVAALETAAEIFKTLITEGPAGLWKWVKDKLSDLKDSVIGSIKDFVLTKVITAGVTWVISLLNPASAFIKACKAIYDVVMFFVERGSQIMSLVNAILDSIINIAKGNISGAAAYVEASLAKAIPVVISFLASLLGLGGISEKITAILMKVREPVNKAIDWVINLAVSTVKSIGRLFGVGKGKDKEPKNDPGGVKGLALQRLEEKASGDHTAKEIRPILGQILEELRPQGLHKLYMGEVDESGSYSVMAEASPLDELRQFVPGKRNVVMASTITLRDENNLEDLIGKGQPYKDVTGKPDDGGPAATRSAREIEGSRTRGGGAQPSAGLQFKPEEGSGQIQLLTWNTTESLAGKNVSHAEKQLVNWLRGREGAWPKIDHIDIEITHSPCGSNYTETCTKDLAEVMLAIRKVSRSVHGHITYTTPFTSGRNATTVTSIKILKAAGWTVDGPPIVDDADQPLHETK